MMGISLDNEKILTANNHYMENRVTLKELAIALLAKIEKGAFVMSENKLAFVPYRVLQEENDYILLDLLSNTEENKIVFVEDNLARTITMEEARKIWCYGSLDEIVDKMIKTLKNNYPHLFS